jgi:ABC-type dipeptide/oligopeptide/nickel transport system permease subunit
MADLATAVVVADEADGIAPVAGRSLAQITWMRLRRDVTGMVSFIVIVIIMLLAAFAPLILNALGLDTSQNLDLLTEAGVLPPPNLGISAEHPLGVQPGTGSDMLALLLLGARLSLFVALTSVIAVTIIGVVFGLVAGYSRGTADSVISRLGDLALAFPVLLMLIALFAPMTQRLESLGVPEGAPARITYMILVFAIFGWPYLTRLVRGQVLSLREREFVEAAESLGAGRRRIVFKEVLPNLVAPILIFISISIPSYVVFEAALAYLGVGVTADTPSWGRLLADSPAYLFTRPLYLFIAGVPLFITVLAFNLFGDSLRDALDPRAGRQ